MKQVDYEAKDGRKFRVLVPDDCPERDYPKGIHIGPPDLDARLAEMGWPKALRVRLHNELHARGLLAYRDVITKHPSLLEGALKAVLKTDMQTIQRLYKEETGG